MMKRGRRGGSGAFLGGRGRSHGIGDTEARLVAAAACCYHAIDAAATPATATAATAATTATAATATAATAATPAATAATAATPADAAATPATATAATAATPAATAATAATPDDAATAGAAVGGRAEVWRGSCRAGHGQRGAISVVNQRDVPFFTQIQLVYDRKTRLRTVQEPSKAALYYNGNCSEEGRQIGRNTF